MACGVKDTVQLARMLPENCRPSVEVSEMPHLQSSLCDGSDSTGLAEGFDERAIFIESYTQNSEREVRRIEAIAACLRSSRLNQLVCKQE